MGWLAFAMPSPVPRNSRVTEVRGLPYAELCCLDDRRYYAPLRLPPRRPGLRGRLIPGPASAAIDLARGRGRASPVDQPAVAACRLPYAGAVPGCSRFLGPDCCLRPILPGSARSVPYGGFFRRGRVHDRYGLQLRFSSLRRRDLARRRRLTTGLLWRLARAGLPPAGRLALRWARQNTNPRPRQLVVPRRQPRRPRCRARGGEIAERHHHVHVNGWACSSQARSGSPAVEVTIPLRVHAILQVERRLFPDGRGGRDHEA
jgi:hypothetical protein